MIHTYEVTADNNVLVDKEYIIHTNSNYSYYERERQAYDIIDYILDNETENLPEYLKL